MRKLVSILLYFAGGAFTLASILNIKSSPENTSTNFFLLVFAGLLIFSGYLLWNSSKASNSSQEEINRLRAENEGLKIDLMKEKELLRSEKDRLLEVAKAIDEKNAVELHQLVIKKEKELQELQENSKNINSELQKLLSDRSRLTTEVRNLEENIDTLEKKSFNEDKKLFKLRELYNSYSYAIEKYSMLSLDDYYKIPQTTIQEAELLFPSRILKLHCMDYQDLRKLFNENQKLIEQKLKEYESRYTTKANKSIYQLMVLALRSELQNILFSLKYERLEKSIEDVKIIIGKYLKIAAEGNQSIAPTLVKFIGEIEYLFTNAINIEYEYYVKKEKAKEEQALLREQMREEQAERKRLQEEQKKIEKEETKYIQELSKLNDTLKNTSDLQELENLNQRIAELEKQLNEINDKKEEIINLQNGKAGNVYIISNIGSFGENVFKIGMTRRLDPMERINELGSASVPFKFDVHSTIFSNDAVDLENKLHQSLNKQRVNLINTRKEFFYSSLDELENLVNQIDPTAEFNKTILAEEYNQTVYMREKE